MIVIYYNILSYLLQDPLLHDRLVLFHPGRERNIIILGPATQRVEQEDRFLVATGQKLALAVLKNPPD